MCDIVKDHTDIKQPCWFCKKTTGTLVFDSEFDTEVHIECIKKALKKDPKHPEAKHMQYLLK
jgi:hypothetical protein